MKTFSSTGDNIASGPGSAVLCRVYYQDTLDQDTSVKTTDTELTHVMLDNLLPNTRYTLHITASTQVESSASEEIIVWTDPAIPATIEVILGVTIIIVDYDCRDLILSQQLSWQTPA